MVVTLTGACTSSVETSPNEDKATTQIVLNALSVTRPDYEFSLAPVLRKSDHGLSITLTAHPIGALTLGDAGRVAVSVMVGKNSTNTSSSHLTETRLSRTLKLLGTSNETSKIASDTLELLSNMGRSVEVVAVAEFVKPTTEAEIVHEHSGLAQPQRLLLSAGGGKLPLGNSFYCGQSCDGKAYMAPFQEWVATLQPNDQPILSAFGLDLDELKSTARRGTVYGAIYENYDAQTLLEIASNPKVKALYIADVNLRCTSDEVPHCRPMRD
ncbi:hypothetical protein [Nonomuraea endophytica]|uniref:hypothetical protein n=1 Tax=Nonomuraea endophytica TaxID=714136 RepID=UPI0037C6A5E0